MTTCTVIHTVAPFRRHRPLLLTLLTAALAAVLAAMLASGLSEPAETTADLGSALPVLAVVHDTSVPAARFTSDRPVDEPAATF